MDKKQFILDWILELESEIEKLFNEIIHKKSNHIQVGMLTQKSIEINKLKDLYLHMR